MRHQSLQAINLGKITRRRLLLSADVDFARDAVDRSQLLYVSVKLTQLLITLTTTTDNTSAKRLPFPNARNYSRRHTYQLAANHRLCTRSFACVCLCVINFCKRNVSKTKLWILAQ